jgi:hypothetical protein
MTHWMPRHEPPRLDEELLAKTTPTTPPTSPPTIARILERGVRWSEPEALCERSTRAGTAVEIVAASVMASSENLPA